MSRKKPRQLQLWWPQFKKGQKNFFLKKKKKKPPKNFCFFFFLLFPNLNEVDDSSNKPKYFN